MTNEAKQFGKKRFRMISRLNDMVHKGSPLNSYLDVFYDHHFKDQARWMLKLI